MKKFIKYLVFIAILILTSFISIRINNHLHKPEHQVVTDTIWVKRFKPAVPYKIIEVPKLFMFYRIDSVKVKEIIHDHNVIQVVLGNNQVLNYSTQFLAQYPNANKLVQFTVKSHKLNLTQFNSQGQLYTEVYNFNPEKYNYIYTQNKLTSQSKGFFQNFGFSADLMFRPMSNLWDANIGLNHKTSIFIYEVGLNAHYYPTFSKIVGFDPYIRIRLDI